MLGLALFALAWHGGDRAGCLALALLAITQGRDRAQAEVFGMTPDPTAFATLGALLVLRLRHGGWLLAIPVAACLVSGAALWAMASPEFWIVPLAAALAAVFAPSCRGR